MADGGVRPILENSTACTMSNAKYLVAIFGCVRFLWIERIVSRQFFSQFNSRGPPVFPGACALDLPVASGRQSVIYGEFDPGSGRTLAACLTHASRTVKGSLLPGSVANG